MLGSYTLGGFVKLLALVLLLLIGSAIWAPTFFLSQPALASNSIDRTLIFQSFFFPIRNITTQKMPMYSKIRPAGWLRTGQR